MTECYYLWQEGLVCKEAVRSQQGVAQLERRPERPHVDDEVPEALPELETLGDALEDRVTSATQQQRWLASCLLFQESYVIWPRLY